MTYVKQLEAYEEAVMQKRVEEMTEDELNDLVSQSQQRGPRQWMYLPSLTNCWNYCAVNDERWSMPCSRTVLLCSSFSLSRPIGRFISWTCLSLLICCSRFWDLFRASCSPPDSLQRLQIKPSVKKRDCVCNKCWIVRSVCCSTYKKP